MVDDAADEVNKEKEEEGSAILHYVIIITPRCNQILINYFSQTTTLD
jgi:hypothetical protein